MNGDPLIVRVRQQLKDVQSPRRIGQFWDDAEIILALNAAQDIFIDFCLRSDKDYFLVGLFRSTNYSNLYPTPIPTNYFHYKSAQVGPAENTLNMAQLYLGAEAEAQWFNSRQNACIIMANNIYYLSTGSPSGGVLHYLKYPSYIGATSLGDNPTTVPPPPNPKADFFDVDFHNYIYNDIFVNHAVVLLSNKETYTSRDIKKRGRLDIERLLTPDTAAKMVEVRDVRQQGSPGNTQRQSTGGGAQSV